MDILRIFEAVKIFTKDEKDTLIGLIFFLLLGLGSIRYVIIPIFPKLENYLIFLTIPISVIILAIWLHNRRIHINSKAFTIALAPLKLLMLDAQSDLSSESRRDLRTKLIDYIYSALYFNKDNLALDKYLQIVKLPKRIKITPKNDVKWVKSLNVDLMIWGDAYYEGKNLHFRPRFEFLKEPKNVFYERFKKKLNELDSFKIDLSKSVENVDTELSHLMNYISFLGVMFHGIELSSKKNFEEAQGIFEFVLKSIGTKSFRNKSLSDIYLATRFFYAQNFHHWGNYLLIHGKEKDEALKKYEKGARAFFKRALELKKLKIKNKESMLEHTLLYGIYLLIKKGDAKQAEKKLDFIKKEFDKDDLYLYYLYKGLAQLTTKKAEVYFDQSLKRVKNIFDKELCFEKIAEYFFSKGKFNQSIKYFEKRLKISDKQVYNPSLLEEDVHRQLAFSYAKRLHLIKAAHENIKAIINERKNVESEKKILVE